MKSKIKVGQAVSSKQAIEELADQPMDIMLSFSISRIKRQILPIAQDFELTRNKRVKELGVLDKEKNVYEIFDEKVKQEFFKEMEDTLSKEVEIDDERLPLSSLKGFNISANDVEKLEWLIDTTK